MVIINYGQSAFTLAVYNPFVGQTCGAISLETMDGETGIWAELPAVKGGDRPPSAFHTKVPQFSRFSLLLPRLMQIGGVTRTG